MLGLLPVANRLRWWKLTFAEKIKPADEVGELMNLFAEFGDFRIWRGGLGWVASIDLKLDDVMQGTSVEIKSDFLHETALEALQVLKMRMTAALSAAQLKQKGVL